MPDPFVTVDDLGDLLGRDVSSDMGAVIALDAASDICRDVAGMTFTAGTATVALDGTGTDALLLPERPVGTVTAVMVNGEAELAFSFTPDGSLFRGTAGVLPRPVWPSGRQNVVATYEFGYEPADFPRSVRMVALSIASRYVVQGVASSESIGGVSVSYATSAGDLTENELRVLRRYRRTRSF